MLHSFDLLAAQAASDKMARAFAIESTVTYLPARGQEFIAIPQMIFANLRRSVALWLKQLSDRRILILYALFGPRQPYHQKTRAKESLPQDKCCSSLHQLLLSGLAR